MRQRLAGTFPCAPLDTFSSILEPLKGYDRDADKYATQTPLNRLVDAIAPESDAAREFRNQVDAYLAAPAGQRNSESLHRQLAVWQQSAAEVRPMMQANGLLTADFPVADAVAALCQSAQEALAYFDSGHSAGAGWKQRAQSAATAAAGHIGEILVQIAPGVQKLIAAVPD
jgi:hexosaminidase